jgi:predicted ATP-grasp superfamily ATP-dependent carboligase
MIFCKSATYHLDQNLVSNYVRLFTENNFHGLVMVEVKYYNGMYYMIEANPRLWGPSQLILDAKMSLFDDFSLENELISKPSMQSADYLPSTVYFWSGGLAASQKKGYEVMFYDYEKEEFIRDYFSLVSNEVYLREDTTLIYLKENT